MGECQRAMNETYYPPDQKPPIAGYIKIKTTDEKVVSFAQKNISKPSSVSRLLKKAVEEAASGEQFPRRGRQRGRKRAREEEEAEPKRKKLKKKGTEKNVRNEKLVMTYFPKTKTKPHIFWKSHSDEDLLKKKKAAEEQRRKDLEQRRRRV